MAGDQFSSNILDNTLQKIVSLLFKNKIYYWFIGYGTLLGIVRNNSCINNDDDIDIIIDIIHYDELLILLEKNKYKIILSEKNNNLVKNKNIFIKVQKDKEPTIDFYFSISNEDIYHDLWEKNYWIDCVPFIIMPWKDTYLLLPKNSESKLKIIYGDDWKTPRQRGEYIGCTKRKINKIK
jgi:phosphorylcholine metabolism protein LicD